MRWSQEGANSLLQVQCAVLNGQDVRNFVRWYPPDRRIERPFEPALTAQFDAPEIGHTHGGRPRVPTGECELINSTNAAHGTTRLISSRNARLRVRFIVRFRPRSACFMASIIPNPQALRNHSCPGYLQSVPRRCGFTSNARKYAPTSAVLAFRLASRVDTGAKGLATDFPTVAEI